MSPPLNDFFYIINDEPNIGLSSSNPILSKLEEKLKKLRVIDSKDESNVASLLSSDPCFQITCTIRDITL